MQEILEKEQEQKIQDHREEMFSNIFACILTHCKNKHINLSDCINLNVSNIKNTHKMCLANIQNTPKPHTEETETLDRSTTSKPSRHQ